MPPPRPLRVPSAREVWTAIRTAGPAGSIEGRHSQRSHELESRTRNQEIPQRRLNLRPEVLLDFVRHLGERLLFFFGGGFG